MTWRNPKNELPGHGAKVWLMLEPHKRRGDFAASLMSVQIVAGEVFHSPAGACIADDYDEYGYGSQNFYLTGYDGHGYLVIAWLPLDEMPLPGWDA